MTVVGIALGFAGLAALSMSMHRHYEMVFEAESGRARGLVLRWLGWLLIGLAAIPGVQGHGLSIGLAVWVSELTVAAVAVVLLMSYVPRAVWQLAALAAVLAVILRVS